jgi:hypothetical protein
MLIRDDARDFARGEVQLGFVCPETLGFRIEGVRRNLFMKSGADLVARLMAGGAGLGVKGMYLEFDNGVDPLVDPTYDRDADISYYNGSLGANRDFLRVNLVSAPLLRASDSTYETNQVSFFALSASQLGVIGEQTFQTGSRVYGGALVAMPSQSDRTQDVVVCRTYWSADALAKDDSHQVAINWLLTFF